MIKKINKVFAVVLVVFSIFYLIKYTMLKNFGKTLICLTVPVFVILPMFFKRKINNRLVFIYYFYVFILLVLGSIADFYSIYEYYDVFTHFMFGFLCCIFGLYLLNIFKIINKNIIFNIIFMIGLTLALAALWEVFEYISSIIFKSDVQNVLKTGVSDTMHDIIASLTASILFVFGYKFNKGKIDYIVK